MTRTRFLIALGAAATLTGGCAHRQAYAPQAAVAPEQAAPSYGIPAQDPKGTVYALSLGGEYLPAAQGAVLYLHLRLAAENTADDAEWVLDANEQTLSLGQGPPAPAAFALASNGGPVISIAKGQRGTLDVFYPLPPGGGAPAVTFNWHVRRGSETVAQTTAFELAPPPGGGYGDGYGAPYGEYAYYRPLYSPGVRFGLGFGWWWGGGYYGDYYGWGGHWGPRYYGGGYRPYYGGYHPSYGGGYHPGRGWAPPSNGGLRGPSVPSGGRWGGSGSGGGGKSGWRGGRR